jgi:hypothetical protein
MNLQRDLPLTLAWWWQWAKELWRTYWLKWLHLQQPAAIYLALLLIPLLAMLGWGAIWLRRVPMRQRCVLPLVVMLALQCLTMAAALLIWAMTIRGTDQARLAYPALPAAAALTAMGLTLPWRRTGRPIAITVTVGLAALSIWTLFGIIRPVYAPPDTEPAGPSRPSIVFGGLLGLEYTVTAQEETLRPGDTLLILTRWQALAPVSRDLGLQLKLQPADGDPVVVDFGTPSTGRYATDRWPTGRIIAARHRITVPEGTPPGIYHLIASVRPSREERWLPITQDGKVVGEEVILKTVAVKQ